MIRRKSAAEQVAHNHAADDQFIRRIPDKKTSILFPSCYESLKLSDLL